eukprot:3400292-Prymnesium_polylepis.2
MSTRGEHASVLPHRQRRGAEEQVGGSDDGTRALMLSRKLHGRMSSRVRAKTYDVERRNGGRAGSVNHKGGCDEAEHVRDAVRSNRLSGVCPRVGTAQLLGRHALPFVVAQSDENARARGALYRPNVTVAIAARTN